MERVIRVESANIETKEKREKKMDAFMKSANQNRDEKNTLVVPAGYLKSEKSDAV